MGKTSTHPEKVLVRTLLPQAYTYQVTLRLVESLSPSEWGVGKVSKQTEVSGLGELQKKNLSPLSWPDWVLSEECGSLISGVDQGVCE